MTSTDAPGYGAVAKILHWLIFEIGSTDTTGVDFEMPALEEEKGLRLAGLERRRPIGLPGLTEPEAVRHYTRLSRQNYAIDLGLFPLEDDDHVGQRLVGVTERVGDVDIGHQRLDVAAMHVCP